MRLNPKDEDKINILKERYGLTQTSEIVRFLITAIAAEVQREGQILFAPPTNNLPNSRA